LETTGRSMFFSMSWVSGFVMSMNPSPGNRFIDKGGS
jgi:hypothetical protein